MKNLKYLSFILIISVIGIFVSCDGAGTTASASDTDTSSSSDADTSGETEMTTLKGTINDEVVKVSLCKAVQQGRAAADTVEISGFLVYGDITMNVSGTLDPVTGEFTVSSTAEFGTNRFVFYLTGVLGSDGTVSDVSISLIVYENDIPVGTYASSLSETEEEVVETTKKAETVEENLSVFGDWYREYHNEDYEEASLHIIIRNASSFVWTDYTHEVDYNPDGTVSNEEEETENLEGSFLYLKKDEAKSTETGRDVYGFIMCVDMLQEMAEDIDYNLSDYPNLQMFVAFCGVLAVEGDTCYVSLYKYSYIDDDGDNSESSMYMISNYSWNNDYTPDMIFEDQRYYTEDATLCAGGYSDLLAAVGNAEYKNTSEMLPLEKQ